MEITKETIKKTLASPLPGEKAHLPLSPMGRPIASEKVKTTYNFKESAIAIILFHNEGSLHSALMQRPVYDGVHSGQVCFPGGKIEQVDQNLLQTALRETNEEIGVRKEALELLGELTPVYIPVSNYKIQPYVFYATSLPHFHIDKHEVETVFSFPLELLNSEDCIHFTSIKTPKGKEVDNVPYFPINGKVVWGATALILNELRVILFKQ